jgi:hypothetical protein
VRIALILPRRRSWRSHRQLIDHLELRHLVRVFVDDLVLLYAWPLRGCGPSLPSTASALQGRLWAPSGRVPALRFSPSVRWARYR